MPDCMLRVAGSTKKVKQFLDSSPLEPHKVYYRGDPGFLKSRGPMKISGFNFSLSGFYGTSIQKQARDVIRNLERLKPEFERMASFKFKYMTLDFGLNDMASEEYPWPTYRLPKKLISLAGHLGFDIVLSSDGPPAVNPKASKKTKTRATPKRKNKETLPTKRNR